MREIERVRGVENERERVRGVERRRGQGERWGGEKRTGGRDGKDERGSDVHRQWQIWERKMQRKGMERLTVKHEIFACM